MAELTYPNRVNTQGVPTLLGTPSVDTASGNIVVTFNPHLALGERWSGMFLVQITAPISTAQPVVFATQGIAGSTPLYRYGGAQAIGTDITTTTGGVLLCFYNADNNRLQLLGTII